MTGTSAITSALIDPLIFTFRLGEIAEHLATRISTRRPRARRRIGFSRSASTRHGAFVTAESAVSSEIGNSRAARRSPHDERNLIVRGKLPAFFPAIRK